MNSVGYCKVNGFHKVIIRATSKNLFDLFLNNLMESYDDPKFGKNMEEYDEE